MTKFIFSGLLLVALSLSCVANKQSVEVRVSYAEDQTKQFEINDVMDMQFIPLEDSKGFNFGYTKSNYWIKLNLTDLLPNTNYKISLNTIIIDSLEVYKQNGLSFDRKQIGEAFVSEDRYLSYSFIANTTTATLYLKIIGRDHPLALPLEVSTAEEAQKYEENEAVVLGIVYGIVLLILVLNLVLYINTFERIYIFSTCFNIFSLFVLLYFDGIIRQFVFKDSLYWNNQFIAISLCGSFIFTNFFILEFLNLKKHNKSLYNYFLILNGAFLVIMAISFWHPIGFNWYLKINLALTTTEVILLSYSIFYIRKKEKDYFTIQLVSIICLNLFGTISQLYFLGVLPLNFITIHSTHFVVLPQIVIQAVALGKRLSLLIKNKSSLSKSLQESAEVYSRSLINTIENERRRLSKDIHDSLGQNLLVIRNSMLKMRKEDIQTKHREKINELMQITSNTLDELRLISQNLRPTMLDSVGLTASIESMIRQLNEAVDTKFTLKCPDTIDNLIHKDVEINIYRIVQELTNNIIKHAKATNATISIHKVDTHLVIKVSDEGIGFDTTTTNVNHGNGLSAVKERTMILKGKLTLIAAVNQGTTAIITIPLKQ